MENINTIQKKVLWQIRICNIIIKSNNKKIKIIIKNKINMKIYKI